MSIGIAGGKRRPGIGFHRTIKDRRGGETAPTIEGGEVLHLPARYEAGRIALVRRLSIAAPGEVR
jgi:hypothetical protein